MKYMKKPVVIEAVRFNGTTTHATQIHQWILDERAAPEGGDGVHTRDHKPMIIHTLEGEMKASPGDYIIKGVQGEFYPCKPDIFKQTYDPVIE